MQLVIDKNRRCAQIPRGTHIFTSDDVYLGITLFDATGHFSRRFDPVRSYSVDNKHVVYLNPDTEGWENMQYMQARCVPGNLADVPMHHSRVGQGVLW